MPIKMPVVFGKNRTRGNSVGAMIDDIYGEHTELRSLLSKEARGQGLDPSADWVTDAVASLLRLYEKSHDAWVPSKGETIGHVYEAELPSGTKLLMGSRQILSQIDEVRIDEVANISKERVGELPRLQQRAGAAYTLYLVASKAIQGASGDIKGVDWDRVHQDVFAKAVGRDKQPVAQVLEAIKLHSPGAVTPEQVAAVDALAESRKMSTNTQKPEWSAEHKLAANTEGWDIFDTGGEGYRLCRIDDPEQWMEDMNVPSVATLSDDTDAWRIVFSGELTHHAAALAFMRRLNPQEVAEMEAFLAVPVVTQSNSRPASR